MLELIRTLQHWIYPPRCMSCRNLLPLQDKRRRSLWLCAHCEVLFLPLEIPGCTKCSVPVSSEGLICSSCSSRTYYFVHNRSAFAYEDLVRDLIHEIKFRRKRHVAQGLGRLWAERLKGQIPKDAILAPVPMHPKKRRERGFDQAEVMAKAIAEGNNAIFTNVLERVQDTPPQSGLHPRQRAENIRDAFQVKPGLDIVDKKFVLVDDIFTTGSSLNECARILMLKGAAQVQTLTLSITIRKVEEVNKL